MIGTWRFSMSRISAGGYEAMMHDGDTSRAIFAQGGTAAEALDTLRKQPGVDVLRIREALGLPVGEAGDGRDEEPPF
jgi:hypothetical protein